MSAKRRLSSALSDVVQEAVERSQMPLEREAALDYAPEKTAEATPSRIVVGDLRFYPDQQPRDMLTDEEWGRLIGDACNDPAGVLQALQVAAPTRASSQQVLAHVEELARSIRSEGILLPLSIVVRGNERIVLDGHCRAMAAVLVGVPDVPIRLENGSEDGASTELTNASHRFILNFTQQRLSPLESMREVVRIVALARQVVLGGQGRDLAAMEPDGAEDTEDPDDEVDHVQESSAGVTSERDSVLSTDLTLRPGQTRAKAIGKAVQGLVLARTGLPLKRYKDLYRLRHLHPEAQALAEGLSEGHLLALLGSPYELQPLVVRLVQVTHASVAETRAHATMARKHGAGYVQDYYARVVRGLDQTRRRTAVS